MVSNCLDSAWECFRSLLVVYWWMWLNLTFATNPNIANIPRQKRTALVCDSLCRFSFEPFSLSLSNLLRPLPSRPVAADAAAWFFRNILGESLIRIGPLWSEMYFVQGVCEFGMCIFSHQSSSIAALRSEIFSSSPKFLNRGRGNQKMNEETLRCWAGQTNHTKIRISISRCWLTSTYRKLVT